MAIDHAPRTRRAVLGAALGGAVAAAATALGRPLAARANDGDALVLGDSNVAQSPTLLASDSAGLLVSAPGRALAGRSNADHESGDAGVVGENTNTDLGGPGVLATSEQGDGLRAISATGNGVNATGETGVFGRGVGLGVGGVADGQFGRGVSGASEFEAVYGESEAGIAVHAVTGLGGKPGVFGESRSGTGVMGYYGTFPPPAGRPKTGVHGIANSDGVALETTGRARFSGAGFATIPAGARSVTVPAGQPVSNQSKVLATLQSNAGGSATVERVQRHPAADTITIHLTANATQAATVAWFIFE